MATEINISVSLRLFNLSQHPELAESVARLMNTEWPRNLQRRIDKINGDLSNKNGFPLHLVITTAFTPINNENKALDPKYLYVIGHAKLTKSHHVKHGFTGIIYDVVIDKRFRGHKLGNMLLNKLEDIALKSGITYLYLSTHSAINFYKKLGYKQRIGAIVSDLRQNANRLSSVQIQKLERLFLKKVRTYHDSTAIDAAQRSKNKTVWLTKRLCRFIAPIHHTIDSVIAGGNICSVCNDDKNYGFCHILPFIEQVGPCCAFAAMANVEYFHYFVNIGSQKKVICKQNMTLIGFDAIYVQNEFSVLSRYLLNKCIADNVTLDGEMYDVDVLCHVLKDTFDEKWTFEIVECDMRNCYNYVCDANKMSFLLVPYDKDQYNNPRVQQMSEYTEVRHMEMDEMDIAYDVPLDRDNCNRNEDRIVASSAHYAVVCGGFIHKEDAVRENELMWNVTQLIERIDAENGDLDNLYLIYMTSSKYGLHVTNAQLLIQSNHSLLAQLKPHWSFNKKMNLGQKMIKLLFV